MTDKQDLRYRIELEEKVICLFVPLLKAFEQVDLHLCRVDFLLLAAESVIPLAILFALLDVFDVESDPLAELEKGLGHVGRDFVDNVPADDHVDGRGSDKVGQPEPKDCDEQVLLHDLDLLQRVVAIEHQELIWVALGRVELEVLPVVKADRAVDEEELLAERFLRRAASRHGQVDFGLSCCRGVKGEDALIDLNIAVVVGCDLLEWLQRLHYFRL